MPVAGPMCQPQFVGGTEALRLPAVASTEQGHPRGGLLDQQILFQRVDLLIGEELLAAVDAGGAQRAISPGISCSANSISF